MEGAASPVQDGLVVVRSLSDQMKAHLVVVLDKKLDLLPLDDLNDKKTLRNLTFSKTLNKTLRGNKALARSSTNKGLVDELLLGIWAKFPRNTDFYASLATAFGAVAKHCLEDTVKLLLQWLPLHSVAYTRMRKGALRVLQQQEETINQFDALLASLKNFKYTEHKKWDLLECVTDQVVADLLAHVLEHYEGHQLSQKTLIKLKDLAFHFFKPASFTTAIKDTVWNALRKRLSKQWAVILSKLSYYNLSLITNQLWKNVANAGSQEVQAYYQGIAWIQFNASDKTSMAESSNFLTQMMEHLKAKKNSMKSIQLIALTSIIQSLPLQTEDSIWQKALDIYKRASKWAKSDDLEGSALILMATILLHGPAQYFEDQYDTFVQKRFKLVWNPKRKDHQLSCLLRLLQGRFIAKPSLWDPAGQNNQLSYQLLPEGKLRKQTSAKVYSFAPLAANLGKMNERLLEISSVLFGKKIPLPKPVPSVPVCVEIILQIAAHSLSFAAQSVFHVLFSEGNIVPVHRLIGLRALRTIVDQQSGWWANAASTPKSSQEKTALNQKLEDSGHCMSLSELLNMFSEVLAKTLRFCDEQAGVDVMGRSIAPLEVSSYLKSPLREYEEHDSTAICACPLEQFRETTRRMALQRLYKVITIPPDIREEEFESKRQQVNSKMEGIVEAWYKNSDIAQRTSGSQKTSEDQPDFSKLSFKEVRKLHKRILNPPNQILIDLYREAVACTPLLLPNGIIAMMTNPNESLTKILIHNVDELACIASHALQNILISSPAHRSAILQGVVNVTMAQKSYEETTCLYTLFSQLLLFTDICIERQYAEKFTSSQQTFSPPSLHEGEAIALLHLCHPNPDIRRLCLKFLHAWSVLCSSHDETSASQILCAQKEAIIQKARFRFLLNAAEGISSSVLVSHDSPIPSIKEIAMSDQTELWAYILCEIGRACVEMGHEKTLGIVRRLLEERLQSLPALPMEETPELAKKRALYFAIAGRASGPSSKALWEPYFLPEEQELTPTEKKELYTIRQRLMLHISSLLPVVLSEVEWVPEGIVLACGSIHWTCTSTLVGSLFQWYTDGKHSKKKNNKAWTVMARILRHIAQEPSFRVAVQKELFPTHSSSPPSAKTRKSITTPPPSILQLPSTPTPTTSPLSSPSSTAPAPVPAPAPTSVSITSSTSASTPSVPALSSSSSGPAPSSSTNPAISHSAKSSIDLGQTVFSTIPPTSTISSAAGGLSVSSTGVQTASAPSPQNPTTGPPSGIFSSSGPLLTSSSHGSPSSSAFSTISAASSSSAAQQYNRHYSADSGVVSVHAIVDMYIRFLAELPSVMKDMGKGSALLTSSPRAAGFADNALLVNYLALALHEPTLYALRGPLRLSVTPSTRRWSASERHTLYSFFSQWHSSVRLDEESSEMERQLSKIKDHHKREEKRTSCEESLRRIRLCSRVAIQHLAMMGPLFFDEHLHNFEDHVEALIESEQEGNCTLRWILGFHFQYAFPLFIDATYSNDSDRATMFINAVYDQFLEAPEHEDKPPSNKIDAEISHYFQSMIQRRTKISNLESSSLQSEDDAFAKRVVEAGGVLLHLILIHMIHPSPRTRCRSFHLMSRLAPTCFGLNRQVPEDRPATQLRNLLGSYTHAFTSQLPATSKVNALKASVLVANACSMFTEKLFKEAFARAKVISITLKRWVIEFLQPWCANLLLDPERTNLRELTPSSFLDNVYCNFTLDIAQTDKCVFPPELILLWQSLAERSPKNHAFIVKFLLKKCCASPSDMAICKTIMLHLYRLDPQATLEPLISHLSFGGIIGIMGKSKHYLAATEGSDLQCSPMGSIGMNVANVTKDSELTETIKDNSGVSLPRRSSKPQPQTPVPASALRPKMDEVKQRHLKEIDDLRRRSMRKAKKTYDYRVAVAGIITDFITDDMDSLLPHLHVLLTYTLLRLDSSEAPVLEKLFPYLLHALRLRLVSLVQAGEFLENRPGFGTSVSALSVKAYTRKSAPLFRFLDTISASLSMRSFRFKWNFSFYLDVNLEECMHPQELDAAFKCKRTIPFLSSVSSHLHHIHYHQEEEKEKDKKTETEKDSLPEQPQPQQAAYHKRTKYDYKQLTEWSIHGIDVSDFISTICKCIKCISPDMVVNWGEETLNWAIGFKDLRLSTKAHQMFRAILLPENDETLEQLLLSLLECTEKMEASVETTMSLPTAVARQNTSHGNALHRKGGKKRRKVVGNKTMRREQINVALCRGKMIEILLTLQRIVTARTNHRPKHHQHQQHHPEQLCPMFWVAVAFLYPTDKAYSRLYHQALVLLSTLVSAGFFDALCEGDELREGMLRVAADRHFEGIQPLLFQALYSPTTEEVGASLLAILSELPSSLASLVNASAFSAPLLVLGLLPWLHQKLKLTPILTQESFLPAHVCKKLVSALQAKQAEREPGHSNGGSGDGKDDCWSLPMTLDALQCYADGKFNTMPDIFLDLVCSELYSLCFPTCAFYFSSLLHRMLVEGPTCFVNSIFRITQIFISQPDSKVYIHAFKNIIKCASERVIIRENYQAAVALLEHAISSSPKPGEEVPRMLALTGHKPRTPAESLKRCTKLVRCVVLSQQDSESEEDLSAASEEAGIPLSMMINTRVSSRRISRLYEYSQESEEEESEHHYQQQQLDDLDEIDNSNNNKNEVAGEEKDRGETEKESLSRRVTSTVLEAFGQTLFSDEEDDRLRTGEDEEDVEEDDDGGLLPEPELEEMLTKSHRSSLDNDAAPSTSSHSRSSSFTGSSSGGGDDLLSFVESTSGTSSVIIRPAVSSGDNAVATNSGGNNNHHNNSNDVNNVNYGGNDGNLILQFNAIAPIEGPLDTNHSNNKILSSSSSSLDVKMVLTPPVQHKTDSSEQISIYNKSGGKSRSPQSSTTTLITPTTPKELKKEKKKEKKKKKKETNNNNNAAETRSTRSSSNDNASGNSSLPLPPSLLDSAGSSDDSGSQHVSPVNSSSPNPSPRSVGILSPSSSSSPLPSPPMLTLSEAHL
ncbi:GH25 family lysozyme M1 (1,4-beta-N-acetylmuramidase) [Balamuthia mandrillaris]